MSKWPGSTQYILDRNFSDHYPILLRAKIVDWGPKPFRVLDCWLKDKTFQNIVIGSWSSTQLMGWGGYSLKQKLKKLKERMKRWNKEQFGDTAKKVQQLHNELNNLEAASLDRQLTPLELSSRKKIQENLWTATQAHESLLRQKARTKWMKEGYCNSRYFHKLINYNRRQNAVKGVRIDGSWVEEPNSVKEAAHNFFQLRFTEPDYDRPVINGTTFRGLGQQQNQLLVARFQEEEIKAAVWECGSDKSLGLDGLNFKFIKHFWELLKPDISCFLDEFHVNGHFPKGCNASFIALISKIKDPHLSMSTGLFH